MGTVDSDLGGTEYSESGGEGHSSVGNIHLASCHDACSLVGHRLEQVSRVGEDVGLPWEGTPG
ncbi:MAG TPA: hypothetical protein VJ508_20565, partial [Saprospiraceae bacterium]|nr:hypothetical protein [Saprospiraceae bacterium]